MRGGSVSLETKEGDMGLQERRAVARFKDEEFPARVTRIQEAAGFAVDVEVRWDELQEPGVTAEYSDVIDRVFFQPLTAALRAITVDAMGQEALQKHLKRIVVSNRSQNFSERTWTFHGGVLSVDHRLVNAHAVDQRTRALRQLLEANL